MTTEELERLAAANRDVPDNLELPEQLLFLTLRELYSNYQNGVVNKERAKREKSRILVAYQKLLADYRITEQNKEITKRLSHHIGDLYKCGCPNCQKLIRIFTGVDRQDIPEDIKELHASNERLRDLVKERSDRNAELATTIDRIRWALEKGDIKRVKEIIKNV